MKPNDELVKILLEHEKLFVFPSFDAGTAWALGSQVRKAFTETPAAKSGKGVVIAIELFTGHTLFRTAVGDGVTADNWSWVTRKLNTVRRFEKSSFLVGRQLALKERTLSSTFSIPETEYIDHGGAIPIRIKGYPSPIGALIVSGLPQDEDHELGARSIAAFLTIQAPTVLSG